MKNVKLGLLAALLAGSSLMAQAQSTNTTREQRMDSALQTYRANNPGSNAGMKNEAGRSRAGDGGRAATSADGTRATGDGPIARGERSVKRGAKRAGHAVAEGGRRAGHFVAEGGRKTKRGLRNAGEAMSRKAGVAPNPDAGAATR